MGTLSEKLQYLNDTKERIKEAIISKGQSVSSSDTFRSYASKISAIETVHNQNKSVTIDGTYSADSGYTGIETITVTSGAVATVATQNEIAEELMLLNDGATTFTLTVSPTDATPVITSTTNSIVLNPYSSSSGISTYLISADPLKTYSYSVSKEGYVTQSGTIYGGTSSLTITLVTNE